MHHSDAFIGLGANLGDPKKQIKNAINLLKKTTHIEILKTSSFYQSIPLDNMLQPDYINSVVKIKTNLKPLDLLDVCQNIENQIGRIRTTKWASRTIDLDILLFAKKTINNKRLIVPHYNMELRGFVLIPLLEIEKDLEMPNKIKIHKLAKKLPQDLWPIILQ